MSQLGALTPINKEQLKLGQALPWAVFDAWGNTLHEAGAIISDQEELNLIIEDGYFEDSLDDSQPNDQTPLPKASQASSFSQPAA